MSVYKWELSCAYISGPISSSPPVRCQIYFGLGSHDGASCYVNFIFMCRLCAELCNLCIKCSSSHARRASFIFVSLFILYFLVDCKRYQWLAKLSRMNWLGIILQTKVRLCCDAPCLHMAGEKMRKFKLSRLLFISASAVVYC